MAKASFRSATCSSDNPCAAALDILKRIPLSVTRQCRSLVSFCSLVLVPHHKHSLVATGWCLLCASANDHVLVGILRRIHVERRRGKEARENKYRRLKSIVDVRHRMIFFSFFFWMEASFVLCVIIVVVILTFSLLQCLLYNFLHHVVGSDDTSESRRVVSQRS